LPTEEEVASLLPPQPAALPRFPLVSGLYTFPWRPSNLFVWLVNGLNLSVLAGLAAAIVYLRNAGGAMLMGIPILLAAAGVVFAWAGIYLANCFLAVVEETANGNDNVAWPKGGGLIDGLGKFFFLLWLIGCAVIPTALVWMARGDVISAERWEWVVSLLPFLVVFPILALSALTADSWSMLLDPKIVWNFLKKPHALALVIVPSLLILALCVWLSRELVLQPSLPVALGAGFAWSTFFVLYGRLLGRSGWILTMGKRRQKRRRRARPARERQTA
jgi:hypothetical protein